MSISINNVGLTSAYSSLLSSSSRSSSSSGSAIQEVFDALDTNKDGVVSAAELAAAGKSSSSPSSSGDSGTGTFLSQSDSDGDGSLSPAEFKAGAQKAQGAANGQMPPPPPESAQAGQNESIDKLQQLLASLGVSTGASTQGSSVSVVA